MESCLPDKVKDSTGKGPVAGGNAVDTRAERRPEWPEQEQSSETGEGAVARPPQVVKG